jgi:Fis family transcriptional regulator, factor for inversion stimulation protein
MIAALFSQDCNSVLQSFQDSPCMPANRGHDIKPLPHALTDCLEDYFRELNGHAPRNLYESILDQVEPPLLRITLRYCEGNQSRAAEWLGLNRATLRKKLKQHKINPQQS